ncbi:MAG: response regulator [Magnetococcales bacterium]|nr:response regulator [Magnetococcales bacterium]
MVDMNETFLTAKQSADLLGVTLPTIHDWVEKGTLRAWRTQGGHRRIAKSSIDAILRQRERELQGLSKENALALLVLEDDQIMIALYKSMVSSWNFPVSLVTCTNGFEALLSIGQIKPDIIIADLAMPNMNGFEMLRTLKERKELESIYVIVVTALKDEEIARNGGLPDQVTLFKKPPPLEKLGSLVRAKAVTLKVTGV